MFNVLQAKGIDSKLVIFPDENHVSTLHIFKGRATNSVQWVLKPENSLVWHHEVINFINKHSGVADN